MNFAFNEEQHLIRQAVADLLQDQLAFPGSRNNGPRHTDLWRRLGRAGFTGALVPTDFGGSGLSLVECGCVLEALGAELSDAPYLMSCVIAADLVAGLPSSTERERLLRGIAEGTTVPLPLMPQGERHAAIERSGRGEKIRACFAPVPHGVGADTDVVLVAAADATQDWKLVVLAPDQAGLSSLPIETPDTTRDLHVVRLEDVDLGAALHAWSIPAKAVARAQVVAAAGLAAEMLGGAARVLELACEHARNRQQFGQSIGRFQAIKHLLADDRVMLDGLQSLVYGALWHLSTGTTDAAGLAHAAKAWAGETYLRLSSDAIQVFGAMGIAAESLPHFYLKRSRMDRVVFGSAERHLDALSNEEVAT